MEWKTVGPDCVNKYDEVTQKEYNERFEKREIKDRIEQIEQDKKEKLERETVAQKTKGIEVEISDPVAYADWKSKNRDGYGSAVFEYAESWAKLMQDEMENGKKLSQCAESTSFQLWLFGNNWFYVRCCCFNSIYVLEVWRRT